MALKKTRGIVLHQIKYGETSIIATIYTEEMGRQAYIIKGSRSKKSRQKANMFQALYLLDMEVYYRESRNLQGIKEVKHIIPFSDIPYNMVKSSICLFLAEVLYRTLKEEESNPTLFEFLINTIKLLDTETKGIENFHLIFLIKFSKFLGFMPSDNITDSEQIFDMLAGRFVIIRPTHQHYMDKEESLLFSKLQTSGFEQLPQIRITKEERSKMLNKLLEFYYLHNDKMGKVKSVEVLSEVFRE